jgi:hypothetical protein
VRSYLKKPITERAGVVAIGIGSEFKPQYYRERESLVWNKVVHLIARKQGEKRRGPRVPVTC